MCINYVYYWPKVIDSNYCGYEECGSMVEPVKVLTDDKPVSFGMSPSGAPAKKPDTSTSTKKPDTGTNTKKVDDDDTLGDTKKTDDDDKGCDDVHNKTETTTTTITATMTATALMMVMVIVMMTYR